MNDAVSDDFIGRDGVQHIDDGTEPLEQFGIALPKFIKRLGLFLEYMKDRIRAVTSIDPVGKWVIAEIFSSLLSVLLQGGIEKGLEIGGCGERRRGHGITGKVSDRYSREGECETACASLIC